MKQFWKLAIFLLLSGCSFSGKKKGPDTELLLNNSRYFLHRSTNLNETPEIIVAWFYGATVGKSKLPTLLRDNPHLTYRPLLINTPVLILNEGVVRESPIAPQFVLDMRPKVVPKVVPKRRWTPPRRGAKAKVEQKIIETKEATPPENMGESKINEENALPPSEVPPEEVKVEENKSEPTTVESELFQEFKE
jgi:hypothetical protein